MRVIEVLCNVQDITDNELFNAECETLGVYDAAASEISPIFSVYVPLVNLDDFELICWMLNVSFDRQRVFNQLPKGARPIYM